MREREDVEKRVADIKKKMVDLEAEADWKTMRAELQNKLERAERRLRNARGKSDAAWEEMRAGMKQAADDLEAAYHRALARF